MSQLCSFQSYGQTPLTSPCLSFLVSAIGAASPTSVGLWEEHTWPGAGPCSVPERRKPELVPDKPLSWAECM